MTFLLTVGDYKMDILKQVKFSQLSSNFETLKKSVSDWVVSIDNRQYNLNDKLKEVEFRLKQLEVIHGKKLR